MKSKDALALTAAKKKATSSAKSTTRQNIPYARSKRPSKKTEAELALSNEKNKIINQTPNAPRRCYINENNGTITAIFNNTTTPKTGRKLTETLNQIVGKNDSFEIQFNKLESESKVFELKKENAKIEFQFIDKTPNKKNPPHRPLTLKGDRSVFWKNVDNKTNITFDVSSKKVTQNLQVNKRAEKYEYSIILDTTNLVSKEIEENKSFQLIDEKNNIFSISAPVLTDDLRNKYKVDSFEIREIANGKTEIAFAFDADIINKEARFPITINPEIVVEDISVIKYQYFDKALGDNEWKAGAFSSSVKFYGKNALEKNILTIDKDALAPIQDQKVFGVYVKIQSDTAKDFQIGDRIISIPEQGYGYLDITKDYFNTTGSSISLEVRPLPDDIHDRPQWRERRELPASYYEAKARRDLEKALREFGHRPHPIEVDPEPIGDVVVEYFIDDEMTPGNETYALAGGVETNVTLDTGETTTSFEDISLNKAILPFKITHTHKKSNVNFYCGKNWRLNLHQSLIKGSSENNGSDYIYTDGNGIQHGFIETYYYFDAAGKKTTINKSDVKFDQPSGKMYYEISGKKCDVFKEQRTTSGLQLTTRIEGFKDIEYYEQRQKEEKQLEDTIYSYKNNLGEYVIANAETGIITRSLKNYFVDNILPTAKFDNFIQDINISKDMVLPKQEALQLNSLLVQKNLYEKQLLDNEKQRSLYTTDSIDINNNSLILQEKTLETQWQSLITSLNVLMEDWRSDGETLTSNKVRQLDDLYWQMKLLKGYEYSIFTTTFYYNSSESRICKTRQNSNCRKYIFNRSYTCNTNLSQESLRLQQKSNIPQQRNNITIQKNLIDDESIHKQIALVNDQITHIISNNNTRIEELKRVYKDYINYEYDLINLKRTMVTACLSDGNKSLCFNQYGDLCALTDSYGNYVTIEYDNLNDRISKIIDDKKTISFEYDYYGLLKSITDYNGNRIEYTYTSSGTNANLKSVKLANGDTIHLSYTSNDIATISSDIHQVKSELTYYSITSDNSITQLKLIKNYSLVSKITDNNTITASETEVSETNVFSQVEFYYGFHECTIINDEKAKRYFMDDRGCFIGGYAQNDEGKFGAYSYAYVNRNKNESFSIHEIDDAVFSHSTMRRRVLAEGFSATPVVSINSEQNEFTIQGSDLPSHHKEFMFTTLISCSPQAEAMLPAGAHKLHPRIEKEHYPLQIPDFSEKDFIPHLYEPIELKPKYPILENIEHHFFLEQEPFKPEQVIVANISTRAFKSATSFMGLKAIVEYDDNTSETFKMPALQRSAGIQLCALPISLNLTKIVSKITLSFVNTTDITSSCDMARLAPAESKNEKFDDFKNVIRTESSYDYVCSSDSIGKRYRKSITTYTYNEQHLLLEKKTECTDYTTEALPIIKMDRSSNSAGRHLGLRTPSGVLNIEDAIDLFYGAQKEEFNFYLVEVDSDNRRKKYIESIIFSDNSASKKDLEQNIIRLHTTNKKTKNCVTKYKYNDKGSSLLEQTYIEGEEATHGILIDENVYDDKNRLIKNKLYNNLESSSKKYTEKEYNEKSGLKQYELDALGENRTSFEYDSTTNNISSITYPSGSKFTYSRDCNTNAITGITQSTEDKEANSIETHYNCGLITKHSSGTNTIEYEYNGKREKSAVYFNAIKKAEYKHEKNVILDNKTMDKSTVTLLGNSREKITTEAYADSKKNIIQTTLNGEILFKNRYSKTNELLESIDSITGINTSCDYDEENQRYNSVRKSAGSENYSYLDAIKESYNYDDFGYVQKHSIFFGNNTNQDKPDQEYTIQYNSDTAHTIKSINLPNGLTYIPQKDFLKRDNGKTLLDKNGQKIFGEYINFCKVGDHTSDMISSINYGERHNGKFSISEGIRYKYDVSGNITERWERGVFAAAYSYDHLNRLIREDNAILHKTWLFSYDKNGNRTTKTELPFTRKITSEITDYTNANIERYSYDGDTLISCNDSTFNYDGFGNPLTFKGQELTWENNKLTKFGDLEFAYDGYGKRIKKGTSHFTYDINNKLVQIEKDNTKLYFIYDDNGLSGISYQNQQFILRRNGLDDITDIFTSNGEHVVHYEYDAWGNHKVLDNNGNEITESSHIGNMNPFRYRGYFYDEETSLYYLVNRYYDPEIGRFISQDQISYLQPETINGLNLFAYCGNNPIMRVDENGCSWFKKIFKKIKSAIKTAVKTIVSGVKKAAMVVAGAAMAVVGFTIAVGAFFISLPTLIPGVSALPGFDKLASFTGELYTKGLALGFYGGFMAAAAFSKDIYRDMSAIGWNPFNTNEDKVLNSKYVSFYKGVPVIRSNTDRAGNFGVIILKHMDEDYENSYHMDRVDVLRHEYGHTLQISILGPTNYFLSVGIPSWQKWGSDDYYSNPWENMANEVGGVKAGEVNHQQNVKFITKAKLLGFCSLF